MFEESRLKTGTSYTCQIRCVKEYQWKARRNSRTTQLKAAPAHPVVLKRQIHKVTV